MEGRPSGASQVESLWNRILCGVQVHGRQACKVGDYYQMIGTKDVIDLDSLSTASERLDGKVCGL